MSLEETVEKSTQKVIEHNANLGYKLDRFYNQLRWKSLAVVFLAGLSIGYCARPTPQPEHYTGVLYSETTVTRRDGKVYIHEHMERNTVVPELQQSQPQTSPQQPYQTPPIPKNGGRI